MRRTGQFVKSELGSLGSGKFKSSSKRALVLGLEVNITAATWTLRSKEKKEIKAKKVSCISLSKAK